MAADKEELNGMQHLLLAMIDSAGSVEEQNSLLDVIDRIANGEATLLDRLGPWAQAS